MPKINIIIVTYNAMKWAEKCFSSLRKSSLPVHCIVIDNGSSDGTQDFIKNQFPEVELIQSPENLGFGKANNIGIEKAYRNGADFFYLMNQDAWIYEDSIQKLLDVYQDYSQKDKIGILSPMHLDGSEKKLDIFLDKYISLNFETRIVSDLYLNSLKPYYEISFINAAHWFIPKHTIEKVGGFNPYFFHYGEDNEYVNRLKYHEKKVILCPKSKVVHDGKQELAKVNYSKYPDMAVDTKILNPSMENSFKTEKRELLKSIFKAAITRDFQKVRELKIIYKRIIKNAEIFQQLRETITATPQAFLNI